MGGDGSLNGAAAAPETAGKHLQGQRERELRKRREKPLTATASPTPPEANGRREKSGGSA